MPMIDCVVCFLLCAFTCTFGGLSPEECNKEDFSKPYVKVFRKLSGAPEKVITKPGFLDLYQYTNKIICLNGPMVVYDDVTFSAARMLYSEGDALGQEDTSKKKRNTNSADSTECVPGENGVPPGFTCSYNGSGTGYITPDRSDDFESTPFDDVSTTTETNEIIIDFMPTTPETDSTTTDATETFMETTTNNVEGETSLRNRSKTPDSYRGGKVLVFNHKCLVLNKLPKEEVLRQREEQNPLTYDRIEQIVPSTKKMGVYLLSVDMSDYTQPGIFQFERPNFEYRPRNPGNSTRANTSHSFALIGTPEDNTLCYTMTDTKGKGTEIQMHMEEIPRAPQICTYAGGNDDSFDDIFRGRSKDGVKWNKCNLANDERPTPAPNEATVFNAFAMIQKGGSGLTQVSVTETTTEDDVSDDPANASGTVSKTVNRCTHAMVKENCMLLPVFTECDNQTKKLDECIFLTSALGLDETSPDEEGDPEKELRNEVLDLVDNIFKKICKHVPRKLPSTVSGILKYYLKDKPARMFHRKDTWRFLIGELNTCKTQATPMKFEWDNVAITTDDDTDSHPNARKSSGGENPIDMAPGYTGVINEGANNGYANIAPGSHRDKRSLDNFFTYMPVSKPKVIPASEVQEKSSERKGRHSSTEIKPRTATLTETSVEPKGVQQSPSPKTTTPVGSHENKSITVTHSIHPSKNLTSEQASSPALSNPFSEKRDELLQRKVRVKLGRSNVLQLVKTPISRNSTERSLGNINLANSDGKYTRAFIEREVRQTPPGTPAAPGETTAAPGGTTAAPGGTTAAPGGTTAAPGGTTAAPGGTTAPPGGTPGPPLGTTAPPGGTTAAPGGTTAAPGGTTAPPGGTPGPPLGTTAPPGGTTAAPGGGPSEVTGATSSSNTPSNVFVPASLPRPIIEVDDFEEKGDNSGDATAIPTNVRVLHEIEGRSVKTPLFYYQEAAELEYMFNSAVDTHWKVFSTVAGYCNKFYKARKSETFPRLYNSYFEDILEPVESIWKSPADNKALGIVTSETTSESASRWLDNCLEGSYIVADSKTYRPPRPLTVKENGEEKTNYFEEIPTENDFVSENARRALDGGLQTEPNPQGRRIIGIGNPIKISSDPSCHWSCDDNDQNCHKECGSSEKAGEKSNKHKILHGAKGEKIKVETNIASEKEKQLGNTGSGPATLGRYMALKKRARMIAKFQKQSKSAKGRGLTAFNPAVKPADKVNQNHNKIMNHTVGNNYKAPKAYDKRGVSRSRSANMKSRRMSTMNTPFENQSKKPSTVGKSLGSNHNAQQKPYYAALKHEDLSKINSIEKRHTKDKEESVKVKADLDLKHQRRKVERYGKKGPLHFKRPEGRKESGRHLEAHKSTTADTTSHALHLQTSVKRSTALHGFKKRKL